jgi:hypothetical protein
MNNPTVFSPWFVVFREGQSGTEMFREYFVAEVEVPVVDPETSVLRPLVGFTRQPFEAMIFMGLNSAARVARAEGAEILVLTSKDDVKRYRNGS